MPATTLAGIFGANATQTATTVTSTKADLATTLFTPSATNTADSILAAIVAFAETNAPDSVASTDPTQTLGIADGYQSITTISGAQYLISPKTLNFYKPFTDGVFNPNNY